MGRWGSDNTSSLGRGSHPTPVECLSDTLLINELHTFARNFYFSSLRQRNYCRSSEVPRGLSDDSSGNSTQAPLNDRLRGSGICCILPKGEENTSVGVERGGYFPGPS